MSVKTAGFLLGLFIMAVIAYGLWYQSRHPRQIISKGSVRVESRSQPGAPMTLETRRVRVAATEFEEVRMPNGTWIGCAGDCRKAALEAGAEFWDALRDRSR